MSKISPLSERRLAENQVIFREANKRKHSWFLEYKEYANKEGNGEISLDEEVPLSFHCECSDENCLKQIELLPSVYNKIHKNDDTFLIACGHEVPDIEDVITKESNYCAVKKHKRPSQASSGKLNETDVDNS